MNTKKKPIDLIMGNSSIRRELESEECLSLMEEKWEKELEDFVRWRTPYLLYT